MSRRPFLAGTIAAAALAQTAKAKGQAHGPHDFPSVADPDAFRPAPPPPLVGKQGLAPVGSARLWYQDAGGDGAPVLLLHSMRSSGEGWGYQMAAFAHAGYRPITYSRRGFRGSDRGLPGEKYTDVDDLAALVDVLKLDRFHIVSTAGGGIVAASFASRPIGKRLISLTLACTDCLVPQSEWGGLAPVISFPQWAHLPTDFQELSPSYRACNPAGHTLWKELSARSRGDNPPLDRDTAIRSLGAVRSAAELGRITAPTLYIAAGADLYTPPPVARYLSGLIPDSRFELIEGAGHAAHWERPDAFNRIVLDFMSRT